MSVKVRHPLHGPLQGMLPIIFLLVWIQDVPAPLHKISWDREIEEAKENWKEKVTRPAMLEACVNRETSGLA